MFKTIKKNKFESAIIVSIFIIAVTLIIYYICNALNLGELSILIALIFSIASAWGSYYYSDKIVLASCRARPATKEEDLKLVNILDALMVTAGLPKKPDLYVVEDAQPNAFATGRNPEHAVICVTTGLLEKLDYYESNLKLLSNNKKISELLSEEDLKKKLKRYNARYNNIAKKVLEFKSPNQIVEEYLCTQL